MRNQYLGTLLLFSTCLVAAGANTRRDEQSGSEAWSLEQFSSLLTFGDSYTDEGRINLFVENKGQAPPPGTVVPASNSTSTGGRNWARYAVQYGGSTSASEWQPRLHLYNYAVSGAVCSNAFTPRAYGSAIPGFDFPDLASYETAAFAADRRFDSEQEQGETYFDPPLTAESAAYAIWIGTNDLGYRAFLTDEQRSGATLVDFVDCVFEQVDGLYAEGARYFVLMNLVPLHRAPLYERLADGGVEASRYWPEKPQRFGGNVTAAEQRMEEQVKLVNALWRYRLPFESRVAERYPGANFALFDVNGLFEDIIADPPSYLNGSLPANVTGWDQQCNLDASECASSGSPDSFLWYDELHPSEQADRIVAREMLAVLSGNGTYATYY